MYSYNFLIIIKITYEELCIKFTSILISIDLYFLNNNKYQKSFEAKPLFNAIPLTLTFGENFKGAEVKNRSIFTALNVVDRHKKKNKKQKKKKHTSFIVDAYSQQSKWSCYFEPFKIFRWTQLLDIPKIGSFHQIIAHLSQSYKETLNKWATLKVFTFLNEVPIHFKFHISKEIILIIKSGYYQNYIIFRRNTSAQSTDILQ
ncbi:hypothetical protein AGLY_015556, partial [Aphis glycines]